MLFTELRGLGTTQSSSSVSSGPTLMDIAGVASRGSHAGQDDRVMRDVIGAAEPGLHRGGLPPRALRRVREFIEAHLEQTISIQALAAMVGLSMCHFARAFKQSQGVTPHDYLVHCRVRRTQELLADTNLPLSEIAIAAGFADQSHCARRFRELVGLTPSRYRWSTR